MAFKKPCCRMIAAQNERIVERFFDKHPKACRECGGSGIFGTWTDVFTKQVINDSCGFCEGFDEPTCALCAEPMAYVSYGDVDKAEPRICGCDRDEHLPEPRTCPCDPDERWELPG